MKTTRCGQINCIYNLDGGCRSCETCRAEPNEINEDCDTCWCCQGDEGVLRWDNSAIEKYREVLVKALSKEKNTDLGRGEEVKKEIPYVS